MKKKILRYGCGVDMGKDKFSACISIISEDLTVKINAQRTFKNTIEGIKKFIEWYMRKCNKEVVNQIFVEVTGVYHEKLLYACHNERLQISLVLGKRVKNYRISAGFDSKTDKEDAQAIAHMSCTQTGDPWKPMCSNFLELRELNRYRNKLVETLTQQKNRLHASKHKGSSFLELSRSIKRMIKSLNKEIELLEGKLNKIIAKDKEVSKKIERILTIPSIGKLTVLTLISETNGFLEFTSIKQLESFAGLDIIENQSGSLSGKTRISKNGNKNIRGSLYMPSISILSTKKGWLYDYYLRQVAKLGKDPKNKKKALVALQRKLLILVYTIWKKGDEYVDYYHLKTEKAA